MFCRLSGDRSDAREIRILEAMRPEPLGIHAHHQCEIAARAMPGNEHLVRVAALFGNVAERLCHGGRRVADAVLSAHPLCGVEEAVFDGNLRD